MKFDKPKGTESQLLIWMSETELYCKECSVYFHANKLEEHLKQFHMDDLE